MRLETRKAPRWSAGVNGRIFVTLVAVVAAVVLAAVCSTYRSMPAEEKLAILAEAEKDSLAELVEKLPETQDELDRAVG